MAWRVDTFTGDLTACTREGCERAPLPGGPASLAGDRPRYAATLSTSNSLWLIDTWTGEVWRCGRASCDSRGLAPTDSTARAGAPR